LGKDEGKEMATLELSKMELPESIRQFVAEKRKQYPTVKGVLIPALMECQKHFGYVSPEMALALAQETDVPFAEVQAVVSFYTMFRDKATGKYILAVCCTWNCEHGGAHKLVELFERKYGVGIGETTKDGLFTMLEVECLADCHNAPSMQVYRTGEDFAAFWCNNLTPLLFEIILNAIEAGEEDALRERLVRVDEKVNPPADGRWIWLVTTHNQYPAKVDFRNGEYHVHDSYGKLGDVKANNPKLYAELQAALKG
jgi:NADH:ubiquinone oxidoreductase subunit E